MKNIFTPAIVRNALFTTFDDMYNKLYSKNPETGKPFINKPTREKLIALKPFIDAIRNDDTAYYSDIDRQAYILNKCLHTSENMSGKLIDVNAISTACNVNPICKYRATCKGSICEHCFAFDTLHRYDGTNAATIINFIVLNAIVYDVKAWNRVIIPCKGLDIFRLEAFGDVASAVQALNYAILIDTHKYLGYIGVWSKNPALWAIALEYYGKPANMVFNLSSPYMNTPANIPEKFKWFIDHVFTVYTAQFALANNVDVNCGGRICKNCKRCYTPGNDVNVNEILKSDSKKYYKALGRDFKGRQ